MSNANSVRVPSASVSASTHDDGVVLFHTGTGLLFSSNRVGSRIWQGLERRLSLDAIATEISREFAIAPDTARDHAMLFLSELERYRLVETSVQR